MSVRDFTAPRTIMRRIAKCELRRGDAPFGFRAEVVSVDYPLVRAEAWSVRVTPPGHKAPCVAYGTQSYRLAKRLAAAVNAGAAFCDGDVFKPLFAMRTLARDLEKIGF